jgi:hypothetical protein
MGGSGLGVSGRWSVVRREENGGLGHEGGSPERLLDLPCEAEGRSGAGERLVEGYGEVGEHRGVLVWRSGNKKALIRGDQGFVECKLCVLRLPGPVLNKRW